MYNNLYNIVRVLFLFLLEVLSNGEAQEDDNP